jgi:Acetyltransferase (GNAT) domain
MKLARLAAVPKNRVANFLGRYFAPALLAEGRAKGSEQNIRCLYAGEPKFQAYIFDLVFAEPPRTVLSRRAYLPRLREVFARPDFDLGVALIPNRYEASLGGIYSYRGTKNVRQETDISAPWEELIRSWQNYSETARRIRKSGLQSRISREPADFDLFYHRMFLPHVRKQYGDRAYVDAYDEIKPWFDRGLVILVEQAGKAVAGGLCAVEGDTLVFYRTGVFEGDYELVKKGAQAAIYYFMLSYAKEQKLKRVNFLMSHAFVHNGVYKHKAGWGAESSPDEKAVQSLLYFLPEGNAKTVFFLEKNPIIVAGEDGTLDVVTGWSGNAENFAAAKGEILRTCAAPGIRRLIVRTGSGTEIIECEPDPRPVSPQAT